MVSRRDIDEKGTTYVACWLSSKANLKQDDVLLVENLEVVLTEASMEAYRKTR